MARKNTRVTIPKIDIDDIMMKIRHEVEKMRERDGGHEGPRTVLTGRSLAGRPETDHPVSDEASGKGRIAVKNTYDIKEFLAYSGDRFIDNAYLGILRRAADPGARLYYYNKLRSLRISKAEILARLRLSREGRSKKTRVKGLFLHLITAILYKIPIVGYLLRTATTITQLPLIKRDVRTLRDYVETGNASVEEEIALIRENIIALSDSYKNVLRDMDDRMADRAETQVILARLSEQEKRTASISQSLGEQEIRLRVLLEEARKRLPKPFNEEEIKTVSREIEHLLDSFYASFENEFRGTRADVKERQSRYLPMIKETRAGTKERPILDLGCGRGEWLELLGEEGLNAEGVDTNRITIKQCREQGLDVTEGDILEFLRKLPDNSRGAVTGFHIVEHLSLETVITLLGDTLRVLTPGGMILFETPNTRNIVVGATEFYIDPTHKRPVDSRFLKFTLEYYGFVRVEVIEGNPFRSDYKTHVPGLNEELNESFYGPRDFAVIGYKA